MPIASKQETSGTPYTLHRDRPTCTYTGCVAVWTTKYCTHEYWGKETTAMNLTIKLRSHPQHEAPGSHQPHSWGLPGSIRMWCNVYTASWLTWKTSISVAATKEAKALVIGTFTVVCSNYTEIMYCWHASCIPMWNMTTGITNGQMCGHPPTGTVSVHTQQESVPHRYGKTHFLR